MNDLWVCWQNYIGLDDDVGWGLNSTLIPCIKRLLNRKQNRESKVITLDGRVPYSVIMFLPSLTLF